MRECNHNIEKLDELLHRASNDEVVTASGNRFIGPLGGGPLFYTHKLFGGGGVDRIEADLGFELNDGSKAFYQYTNGTIIFDNCLFVFGHVADFNRSLELDKQRPISLAERVEAYSGDGGTAPMGSVGANRRFDIICDKRGSTFLVDNDRRVEFCCLTELVTEISQSLEAVRTTGLSDEDYDEAVDAAVGALFDAS